MMAKELFLLWCQFYYDLSTKTRTLMFCPNAGLYESDPAFETLETGGSHWSIYDLKACSTFFCFPPRDRWLQEIFDPTHFQSLLIMLQPMKTFRFVCSKSGITFIQTHVWTEHQPGFSFLLIGRNKTDTIDEVS